MVAQQAFSVYCNEVVRAATDENKRLKAENASLEPIKERLQTVKFWNGAEGTMMKEFNIFDDAINQDQDNEFLSFTVEGMNDVPLDHANRFTFFVSGQRLGDVLFMDGIEPELKTLFDGDAPSAELVLHYGAYAQVRTVMSNFAGTIEEVEEAYAANRLLMHILDSGFTFVAADGSLMNDHGVVESCLEGATLSIKNIDIRKSYVDGTLSCAKTPLKDESLTRFNELEVLSKVDDSQEGLLKVFNDYQGLASRNTVLKAFRAHYQTMEAQFPEGPVRFNLENGSIVTTVGGNRLFKVEPNNGENTTIPLASMCHLEVTLSGVPFPMTSMEPFFVDDSVFAVTASRSAYVVFSLDESISRSDRDELDRGNLLERIRSVIRRDPEIPLSHENAYKWTVTLLDIRLEKDSIEGHLRLLGINDDATEKDDPETS